jgi:hypothetical protein
MRAVANPFRSTGAWHSFDHLMRRRFKTRSIGDFSREFNDDVQVCWRPAAVSIAAAVGGGHGRVRLT